MKKLLFVFLVACGGGSTVVEVAPQPEMNALPTAPPPAGLGKEPVILKYAGYHARPDQAPGAWVAQPSNYVSVGMSGVVNGTTYRGRIDNPSCGNFTVRRSAE